MSYLDKSTMKAFSIFTVIALTTLINGSSALWCECRKKAWPIDEQNVDDSRDCCTDVMGTDLMDGPRFFGLSRKDWCDTSRDKVEKYKACCATTLNIFGYCK